MTFFLRVFAFALVATLALPRPLLADPADIGAASRSVVRVILVASDGEQVFYVGHGSGVAVAPDRILTNAHVVAPLQEDASIRIGIVPSEGTQSYGARVVAYSPGNDLALLAIEKGRVTPASVFTGPVEDGTDVFAIGYPGNVDRAQGLELQDLINPQSAVRTRGSVSGGRSAKSFDTLLHTAAIGAGNSGGPLVDNCGRVLGVNSFGSLSDGSDAEFFFAVSAREILPFLRRAGVRAQGIGTPCRSVAELTRAEAEREAAAAARADLVAEAERDRRAAAEATARRQAELAVIAERENAMALAGLLLALAVVAGGGAMLLASRGQRNPAIAAGGASALLLLGAVVAFLARPAMADIEDRAKLAAEEAAPATALADGRYLCRLIPERSRITVTGESEVELAWRDGGCVNGRTQYAPEGARWSRVLVPQEEATVSVIGFSPATRSYSVARYLLPLEKMEAVRAIRQRFDAPACTTDRGAIDALADMQTSIRAELPASPNELLTYDCRRQAGAP